jgi:hypothetical protein
MTSGIEWPHPAAPFVWPSNLVLAAIADYQLPVPFQRVLEDGSCLFGIIGAIDHLGAEWLKTVLDPHRELRAAIILALFGGCPTRRRDLNELLEIQTQSQGRLQFRLLTMSVEVGSSVNFLAAPRRKKAMAPLLAFGPSPNFGLAGVDRTQVNLVFPIESALFDQLRRWFDVTWYRSTKLTTSTADIPALVPATGTPEAAAKWASYCALCAKDDGRRQGRTDIDPETGELRPQTKPDGTVDQLPTAMLDLPQLDRLAECISRIVANGRQVTIGYSSAVRPLDAPMSPATFGQQSEYRDGSIIQRLSFRVSIFDDTELKKINEFRRGSQAVIEKLGLPLEKALYWVPNSVVPIVEAEIQAMDEQARQELTRLVGNNIEDFIKSKTEKIKQDLSAVYRRLGGEGEVPSAAVNEMINDLTRRIEMAIGDRFVAPVTFSEIRFSLSSEEGIQAPWAQAAKLSWALARFPRVAASKPKTFAGLQTVEAEILVAMNVANDIFATIPRDHMFARRARGELQLLDRIAETPMSDRDRCDACFMLMAGAFSRDIDRFIAEKESTRPRAHGGSILSTNRVEQR